MNSAGAWLMHICAQVSLVSLGKWRYVLTGVPLAVLCALVCRTLGQLFEPLGEWRVFQATCEAVEESPSGAPNGTRLRVSFVDGNRVQHTVSFPTSIPAAQIGTVGTTLRIAVQTKAFQTGLPADIAQQDANAPIVCLRQEQRRLCRRAVWHHAWKGLLACGLALAVVWLAMRVCFPPHAG